MTKRQRQRKHQQRIRRVPDPALDQLGIDQPTNVGKLNVGDKWLVAYFKRLFQA